MGHIREKRAVYLESPYQHRVFKSICKDKGILVVNNREVEFPFYEMLINTPCGCYTLPNNVLEGHRLGIMEQGYVPLSLKQFEDIINNEQ